MRQPNATFKCTDDSTLPACPGVDIRRGTCELKEPICMGCNPSIGGFTCHCAETSDAAVNMGEWQCIGTGRTCR